MITKTSVLSGEDAAKQCLACRDCFPILSGKFGWFAGPMSVGWFAESVCTQRICCLPGDTLRRSCAHLLSIRIQYEGRYMATYLTLCADPLHC
jgi:hypothetical protein